MQRIFISLSLSLSLSLARARVLAAHTFLCAAVAPCTDNFSDVPTMKKMIAADKFIEHAEVHGKYYGTSFASVETVQATGKICILDIDVQGCRSCRAAGLKGKYIFLRPPSIEELERRLRGRGTEKEEAIVKRLAGAQGEIDASAEDGLFDQTITNDDLEDCFNQVNGLLAQAIAAAQKGRAAKAAAAAPSAASK